MVSLFVTFGVGQFGGALAHSYLEFEVNDQTIGEFAVRRFMHTEFKGQWCGLYTEAEFKDQPKQYSLTRLVKYDEHGNVLTRGPNVDRDL